MKAWHWIVGLTILGIILAWGWSSSVTSELKPEGNTLSALIAEAVQVAKESRWEDASDVANRLADRWESKKFWFSLNVEDTSFNQFERAIHRIKGGLEAHDSSSVLVNVAEAEGLLKHLASLVPSG